MGHSKSGSKREIYSYTSSPQETRKISNKQPNLISKGIRDYHTEWSKSNRVTQIYGFSFLSWRMMFAVGFLYMALIMSK